MQDAMTIWDSICHSQWFKQTSIVRLHFSFVASTHSPSFSQILFLNKEDLFDQRIKHSDVKNFFPVGCYYLSSTSEGF